MNDDDMELSYGIAAFEAKEFRRAWDMLEPMSDAGIPEAQYRCAIMLQNGLGVIAQPEKGAMLMKQAAGQSLGLAQHALGVCYLFGEGVTQNTPEAIKFLELAGESGLAGSWSTLGMIFTEGQGVDKDAARAHEYYRRAGFDSAEFTSM